MSVEVQCRGGKCGLQGSHTFDHARQRPIHGIQPTPCHNKVVFNSRKIGLHASDIGTNLVELRLSDIPKMVKSRSDEVLILTNVLNCCHDLRIYHVDSALDICCALSVTAILVLKGVETIGNIVDRELPIQSLLRSHLTALSARLLTDAVSGVDG